MMFSKIKELFGTKPKTPENIIDISGALSWIKTYRKAGDFNTALMATRELILKSQTGITYYENVLRKIAVLENSNIEKIAKTAREKRKKVNLILSHFYKELRDLEKIIGEIEKERFSKQSIEDQKAQKLKFKLLTQELDTLIKKKDYTPALAFAKKLISDYPNEPGALQMLTKTQKLYENEKSKQEKNQEKDEKLQSILKEVGVEMQDLKVKKNVSFITRITLFIKNYKIESLEKREYLGRQKALKDIERLLVQSGTIENISDEDSNNELLSITHSGLTKDINDFSIHGFDFFGKIHGKDKIVGDTFGYHKE